MQEICVRAVDASQAGLVAELVAGLLEEIMHRTGQQHFQADAEALAETAADLLARGSISAFLAWRGAQAVGVATMSFGFALYAGGAVATLTELYIRPDQRGQGIGTLLLRAVDELARSRALKRVEVTTPPLPAFDRTLAFYQSHGFSVTGGRKLKYDPPAPDCAGR